MLSSSSYTGDGATTAFEVGFEFISEADIRVFVGGVLKTRGTDYSVQNPTSNAGKTAKINFNAAPAGSAAIGFFRNTPMAVPVKNPTISHLFERVAVYRMQERDEEARDLNFVISSTDLLAHTAQMLIAPCDGYIEKLTSEVDTVITTGGTLTVDVAGAAVTGLSITVANSAAAGTTQTDTPTTPHDASTKVLRGQAITIIPASFATAGAVSGFLTIQPADLG